MRTLISVLAFWICFSSMAALESWVIHCDTPATFLDPAGSQEDPSQRVEEVARSIGYTSPEGSSLSADEGGLTIRVTNTPENVAIIRHVLTRMLSYPTTVSLHAELLAIDPELATRWGLDGGVPTAPEESPIEGPMTPLLPADKAATLMKALRSHEQVMIVQSLTSTTYNATTTVTDAVTEARFAESFTAPQTRVTDEETVHYPQTEEYGDAEEVGVIVRWTPSALDPLTRGTVVLDTEPVFRALIGYKPSQTGDTNAITPLFYRSSIQFTTEMRSGDTLMKPAGRMEVPEVLAPHVSSAYLGKYLLWTFTPVVHLEERGFSMTEVKPERPQAD